MAFEEESDINPGSIGPNTTFNFSVPKFGENRYNTPTPPGMGEPTKPVKLAHTLVGTDAKQTAANINSFLTSKIDYNNYGKLTSWDAGPNGANLARYKAYGEETFRKIGFDPSINNETKFNEGTTWWDDTKRMFTKSFVPLFVEGLKANLKSYVDIGSGDFGQDIRAAANYEKYSNIGYSSKTGLMPFLSNTTMSYAYTAGILTEAITEAALLRRISPSIFGGKDFLLSAPRNIAQVTKSGAEYLKDMKNINAARSVFNNALSKTANFINPAAHTWDNFVTNVYKNQDNISNLARAQRTFGAFYKDIRNMNMAMSEAKLEGGFVENKTMNDLYNDHYFRTGEVPDEKTMEIYQRKAEAAGFSATMQNAALVFYTNKITLPTLMKMGPFKALDDVGRELAEGTLVKTGKGLKATVAYEKRNILQGLKNLYKPKTWGRGGLNYFKANLMEGLQENLQDVIADSTQAYYTNSIFQPERGKYEMYMAGLKHAIDKQMSSQGLETFASGFLMGFGNTVVESVATNMLKGAKYLKDGKGYINYLNERHNGGQQLADIVNAGLTPTKFFGSRIFDHGNQALMQKEIEAADTDTKEKKDTQTTSFISSVMAALDTGTFDMYIDNLESMKQMSETEIEDTFKLKSGEGKKALDRIDKIIEKAKTIQSKHEYHESKFKVNINPNDYKEGTIEREHADLMVEAHRKAKYNAIFLDASYEDNVERINKMGESFVNFIKYAKADSNVMMSDLNAIYDREALKSEIKLLEAEIESAQGVTDPGVVAQRERSAKKLERLKKFDKAQSEFDAVEESKLNGSMALIDYLKKKILDAENTTEEDKQKVKDSDEKILKTINEIETRYKMALKDYLVDIVGGTTKYEEAMRNAEADNGKDIDILFTQLKDIKKLDVENQAILRYVNILKDPGGYYEHVQKNYKWMKALYATKKEHIRQMIEKSLQTKEYQDLLKSLSDDGVFVDLEEFAKWVQNKSYQPKEFIDTTKEIVIPKGSDRYLEYYSRFVKVAKAQEQRIASEKINKEQSIKDRKEELDKMKQKELDDVRTAYHKELKTETGKTEAELIKARTDFEEQNTGNLNELKKQQDELIAYLNLIRAVNSPVLLASFEQVKNKHFESGLLDSAVFNQLQEDIENSEEEFKKATQYWLENKKRIKSLSEDDLLLFSMQSYSILKMIDTKLAEIEDKLSLGEAAAENPNLDYQTTKAYKLYQQRVSEIEAKYNKAFEESKEDIENFDDDAPRRAQITVTTPWEQLPKELIDILQPSFEAYIAGKDFPEEDLYEIRQNWLLTQNSVIQTYLAASVGTTDQAIPISDKIPKLKTLPKEQQEVLDKSQVGDLSLTVGIRKVLERKLEKKQEPPLTKEAKAAIQSDIDALQKYINYQRSVVSPQERLKSIAEDFEQRMMELQKEVGENVVNGRRKNYILDQGTETETIPQRVTELTDELIQELDPDNTGFLAGSLKDTNLLLAIDQLLTDINEGTIKKDAAIEAFIATMRTLINIGKLRQFNSEKKLNDIRGLLYMDSVKRGVMTKEEAIAGLTRAKLGKSQYVKDIEAYQEPASKPTTTPSQEKIDVSEGEAVSVHTPRKLFKGRLERIKENQEGKRRAQHTVSGDGYVVSLKQDDFNETDEQGRPMEAGAEVYLNENEVDEIKKIEQKAKMKLIDNVQKQEALQQVYRDVFKRALDTYEVVDNANFETSVEARRNNYKAKTTPTAPVSDKKIELEKKIKKLENQIQTTYRFKEDTDINAAVVQAEKDIEKYETELKKLKDELAALETPVSDKKADIESKTKEELFPIDSLHKGKESGDTLKVIGYTKDGVRFEIQTEGTLKPTKNVILSELKRLIKEDKLTSDVYAELAALEGASTTEETDLEDFGDTEKVLSLSGIMNILGDVAHQESSDVGTTVDDMIREYLAFREPTLPSYMTKNHPVYLALFGPQGIIQEIRDGVVEGKYTILSDHVKVFDRNLGPKDATGKPMGLAGETDLIFIDNNTGEIDIIDIKTAKPNNWTFWNIDKTIKASEIKLEEAKKKLEAETNAKKKSLIEKDIAAIEAQLVKDRAKWSNKLKYSIQQTIYRNLIYRMTGKMPRAIKLLPLQAEYNLDGVITNIKLAKNVVDKDAKGNPGMFITLEPVPEVNKYVPIGKVKETIETPEDVEFEETEVISNQISNNLGKSFVYNGAIGTLMLTPEGTYALDTPTEIIEITLNGNNKITPDTTINALDLSPIKITQRPFMTINIDGKDYTISNFDATDDSIIIDGVKYKALRTNKTKKINGVEFMSNQKAIEDVDAQIREVSEDLVKRKEEGKRDGENINQFLERTAERKIELDTLIDERSTLVANNKIRKITGTNAQDLIYIINQSPEIFLSDTSKDAEQEQEELDLLKSFFFLSDATFNGVLEIMKARPASLDLLIIGESDKVSASDIEEIKDWIKESVSKIELSNNPRNQAAFSMLKELANDLELIKYTKNGKINKRSIKSIFRESTKEKRSAGVSDVQGPTTGQTEGVPGQTSTEKGGVTPQEGKEIIDSVKGRSTNTENLQNIFEGIDTEGEVEGYEEIRTKIMAADEAELEAIMDDLFKKAIRNEITLSETALDQLYQERLFQLQENVTVKDVKKNQKVVNISAIANKETDEEITEGTIFKVTKVNEKSVVLQSLENTNDKVEMSAADFAKKFKPYMAKRTTKTQTKKPITKEYKDVSLDVAEELDNFAQDQSNIQAIQEEFGNMTEDEADNAFMDAVKKCKIKTK